MERNDEGRDVWVLDGTPFSSPGLTAVAGWPEPFPAGPKTYEECPRAAYDADARLEYMDDVGIWAQVLYPNVAGFGSQRFLSIRDDELKLVCVSVYNDFLRDWASADAAPPAHGDVAAVLGHRRDGEGDHPQPRRRSPRHPLHR